MALLDFVPPRGVLPALEATSRKDVLLAMCALAERLSDIPTRTIFDAVLGRERLGSTGIGDGIAVPHARLPGCRRTLGVFAHLRTPVDFGAIDGTPVDLVLLLLAPDASGADHLSALSRAARTLRDADIARVIRGSRDPALIHAALTGDARRPHAA